MAALVVCLPRLIVANDPEVEAEIVELLRDHAEGQGRVEMIVDPALSDIAQIKADDMIARDYLAHTDPSGVGPNFLAQREDYFLPVGYSNKLNGNNIESLAEDRRWPSGISAARAVDGWVNSPSHRTHVLGENEFFSKQVRVGVGVATNVEEERNVYVFLSSAPPAPQDVLPPQLIYERPKEEARAERRMFHRGFAYDPSAIAMVQYRLGSRPWKDADFEISDKSWTCMTRLSGGFYRKVRKGKRNVVVKIRAIDRAGNVSQLSRRFKGKRR